MGESTKKTSTQSNIKTISPNKESRERTLLARLPKPINCIRKEGNKVLNVFLENCFSSTDDTLFDLAQKAVKQEDQDGYFFAMSEIRNQKNTICEHFIGAANTAYSQLSIPTEDTILNNSVPMNDWSVVGNDDLDEIVAKEALTLNATTTFEHPLKLLTSRINAIVLAEVEYKAAPMSPSTLCDLFSSSVKAIDINTKSTLVLFKIFEQQVLNNLGSLYNLMNTLLAERGVLPESNSSIDPPQSNTSEHKTHHDGSGGLHMPVVTSDAISEDVQATSLLDLLSQQQTQNSGQNYLSQLLTPAEGLPTLQVSPKETRMITILDRLFQTVGTRTQIAAPVKALLQDLQIPLAKIALTDSSFFKNPKHSARQLLNTLSAAAISCDTQSPKDLTQDPLFQQIEKTVQALVQNKMPTNKDFSNQINGFKEYETAKKHKEDLFEKKLILAEQGRLKTLKVERAVNTTIEDVCQGMEIHASVERIIHSAWKKVMTYTALTYGCESAQWDDALETLIELVTSTQDYANEADRSQAKESLNILNTKITEGLLSISFNEFKTEKLIKELKATFQKLSNKKEEAKTLAPIQQSIPQPIQEAEIEIRQASEAFYIQAKNLSRGTWFDFKQEDYKSRCRLAAIIAPYEQYIFVNNKGLRVTSNNLEEVALMLQEQTLVYLDSNHIFDTALEQIINDIKKNPNSTAT